MTSPSSTSALLVLLSGPSGSGKTTLCQRLWKERGFRHAVSATTRQPREGEVNGEHYHFLSLAEFEEKVQGGEFLEHAEVHGNHYGTLKSEVLDKLAAGQSLVMDIDIQGAQQLRLSAEPLVQASLVDIFVAPSCRKELEQRLAGRGTDAPEVIELRLQNALEEAAAWPAYRFVIPSASHEEDWQRLQAILTAESLRSSRQDFDFG